MEPPKNVQVYDAPASISWMDENGIICSVSKKVPPQTIEESKKEIQEFRKRYGEGKFCMLLDITNASPTPKEVRDWAAEELNKLTKAMALISKSALGRMVANLFFGLKPPPYPTRMFENEKDAKEWLKQYL
jgi:CO dehydrogenase/acetyl-CoA synthase gamma subunit (corrinoid Fe-S protein)